MNNLLFSQFDVENEVLLSYNSQIFMLFSLNLIMLQKRLSLFAWVIKLINEKNEFHFKIFFTHSSVFSVSDGKFLGLAPNTYQFYCTKD